MYRVQFGNKSFLIYLRIRYWKYTHRVRTFCWTIKLKLVAFCSKKLYNMNSEYLALPRLIRNGWITKCFNLSPHVEIHKKKLQKSMCQYTKNKKLRKPHSSIFRTCFEKQTFIIIIIISLKSFPLYFLVCGLIISFSIFVCYNSSFLK
jgi:hypothetical protein